jgi:hypothetical protein
MDFRREGIGEVRASYQDLPLIRHAAAFLK